MTRPIRRRDRRCGQCAAWWQLEEDDELGFCVKRAPAVIPDRTRHQFPLLSRDGACMEWVAIDGHPDFEPIAKLDDEE